jgi:hypothetical protein
MNKRIVARRRSRYEDKANVKASSRYRIGTAGLLPERSWTVTQTLRGHFLTHLSLAACLFL